MRPEYTLAEVASAVGMTERNVRAYRSRGLIRPPRMRGRVGYYGREHLAQLRLVQGLLGRGLGLSVISQLVERGIAHTELARLMRDELDQGAHVPLSTLSFDELESAAPGLVERMAQLGLGARTADGYQGDPTFFALANLVVSHGLDPLATARISEAAAELAQQLAADLPPLRVEPPQQQRGRGDADGAGDVVTAQDLQDAVVELATTAFRLALRSRVSGPGR